MEIPGRPPSAKGPAEWFTGDVWIDNIVRGEEPSHVRVSAVRFTPGARTAWHSHAVGQTLYVTDGEGLVQARGGQIVEIRSGDVDGRYVGTDWERSTCAGGTLIAGRRRVARTELEEPEPPGSAVTSDELETARVAGYPRAHTLASAEPSSPGVPTVCTSAPSPARYGGTA